MSSLVLVPATVYVGWLAERFTASRALAVALLVVGVTAAIWRWAIARAASVEVTPWQDRESRIYRALDQNAYLICLLWAPATLFVYPVITDRLHAATYALCAMGSMGVASMFLLPLAFRGYRALTGTHIAAFFIASVLIESSRSWVTALLLAIYAVVVYRISERACQTTQRLMRMHRATDQWRSEATQSEQAMLVEAVSAARSAELWATEQQLFIAKIGNGIRTPAQIVMSDVEFLEHRLAGNPELHLTLRRLRSATELISHQLLTIAAHARSQSWRPVDRHERVALPVLMGDIANLHASAAAAKGLNLRIDAQDIVLNVDAGKLRQIVENLVGNAVKYTARGEVTVSARVIAKPLTRRELVIVVADTGIGIADDLQGHVFEPCFRVHGASHGKDGLGIGLAIVKSLVTKLGGRVELRSRAGQGTAVIVAIPLAE